MGKELNINDYTSLPTTPYREFVDKIQDRIKYINGMKLKDEDRLSVLRGALLDLLEINSDNIVELSIDDQEALFWADNDY